MDLLSDDLLYCCLARVPFASYDALRLVSRRLRGACGSEGYARERDRFRESLVVVCGGSDWGYRREAWLLTPDRTRASATARPRSGEAKLALVAVAPRRRRPAEQRRISVTQKPLLVVAGGYRDDAELASAEALDLATGGGASRRCPSPHVGPGDGRVGARADLPQSRQSAAAVVVAGRLSLIGGLLDLGETASVIRYCPTSDAWQWGEDARAIPWLPKPRSGATAALLADGSVLLVGGGSPLVCRRDGDGYRAWEDVADLPTGWVRWPGAATVEL
ncbi:hypothetical protein JL720_9470 [Aureococcus anophagefferens]|nr:hypothetical protein JL720_9470 [Aureococcus anophagefferens]